MTQKNRAGLRLFAVPLLALMLALGVPASALVPSSASASLVQAKAPRANALPSFLATGILPAGSLAWIDSNELVSLPSNARIDGTLVILPAQGAETFVLRAQDDLTISGRVVVYTQAAGEGLRAPNGVSLDVRAGNALHVTRDAILRAGDGTPGISILADGAGNAAHAQDGGKGGDVTIHAPTVTIEGTLQPGNGANGGNAAGGRGADAVGGNGGDAGQAFVNDEPQDSAPRHAGNGGQGIALGRCVATCSLVPKPEAPRSNVIPPGTSIQQIREFACAEASVTCAPPTIPGACNLAPSLCAPMPHPEPCTTNCLPGVPGQPPVPNPAPPIPIPARPEFRSPGGINAPPLYPPPQVPCYNSPCNLPCVDGNPCVQPPVVCVQGPQPWCIVGGMICTDLAACWTDPGFQQVGNLMDGAGQQVANVLLSALGNDGYDVPGIPLGQVTGVPSVLAPEGCTTPKQGDKGDRAQPGGNAGNTCANSKDGADGADGSSFSVGGVVLICTPGMDGKPGDPGLTSGDATGGNGGNDARYGWNASHPGKGGDAFSYAGNGGNGGMGGDGATSPVLACPPGNGGNGGDGGNSGNATGGNGGRGANGLIIPPDVYIVNFTCGGGGSADTNEQPGGEGGVGGSTSSAEQSIGGQKGDHGLRGQKGAATKGNDCPQY